MFTGLTEEMCSTAFGMIMPSISAGAGYGILGKEAGTIIVLDPILARPDMNDVDFDLDGIMFTGHVNEPNDMYSKFAKSKAWGSLRTGLPSRVLQQESPHLYELGDTKWGGSIVRNGLIVAFSGVQAVFDEMIAGWMADALIAMCRHEMTKPDGVMVSDGSYIGLP